MRIHTDVLTSEDFYRAISAAGLSPDVWVDECNVRGSRRRNRAFEVRLAAEPGRDKGGKARRPRNSGQYGAENGDYQKAATYDEHGYWMAELFRKDPTLIIQGCYDGAAKFHALTKQRFS